MRVVLEIPRGSIELPNTKGFSGKECKAFRKELESSTDFQGLQYPLRETKKKRHRLVISDPLFFWKQGLGIFLLDRDGSFVLNPSPYIWNSMEPAPGAGWVDKDGWEPWKGLHQLRRADLHLWLPFWLKSLWNTIRDKRLMDSQALLPEPEDPKGMVRSMLPDFARGGTLPLMDIDFGKPYLHSLDSQGLISMLKGESNWPHTQDQEILLFHAQLLCGWIFLREPRGTAKALWQQMNNLFLVTQPFPVLQAFCFHRLLEKQNSELAKSACQKFLERPQLGENGSKYCKVVINEFCK